MPLSSRPPHRFAPALRRIAGELKIGEPLRSRIILEIAADLNAAFEHYRGQGLSLEEAARRTEDRFAASGEALQALVAVHTTPLDRLLSRLVSGVQSGVELALLFASLVPILLIGALLAGAGLEPAAWGWEVWSVLLVAVTFLIQAGRAIRELIGVRREGVSMVRRRMGGVLLAGSFAPVVGLIAFLSQIYRIADLFASTPGGPGVPAPLVLVLDGLARGATALGVGLLIAASAGLMWLAIAVALASTERRESAALLGI